MLSSLRQGSVGDPNRKIQDAQTQDMESKMREQCHIGWHLPFSINSIVRRGGAGLVLIRCMDDDLWSTRVRPPLSFVTATATGVQLDNDIYMAGWLQLCMPLVSLPKRKSDRRNNSFIELLLVLLLSARYWLANADEKRQNIWFDANDLLEIN